MKDAIWWWLGGGGREIDQFNQFDQIDQFGNFQKRKRKRNPPIQTKVKPFDLKFLTNCNNFKQQTKLEMSHPKIGIQKLAVLETTVKYSAGNWRSDWLKYWNIQNCGLIVSNSKLNVQKFQLEIGNSSKKFGMYLWNWTKPRKFQTKKLKWFKNKKNLKFQSKYPKLVNENSKKSKNWNIQKLKYFKLKPKTFSQKSQNWNIQKWPNSKLETSNRPIQQPKKKKKKKKQTSKIGQPKTPKSTHSKTKGKKMQTSKIDQPKRQKKTSKPKRRRRKRRQKTKKIKRGRRGRRGKRGSKLTRFWIKRRRRRRGNKNSSGGIVVNTSPWASMATQSGRLRHEKEI